MRWRSIRLSSLLIMLGAGLLGGAAMSDRIGGPIERALEPIRFGIHQTKASGNIVVVEMDAASAAAIRRWPWPRRNYATVIDRLRAAGARSIVFDVDFSDPSNPADDALLAQALARSGGLVALATFGQQAGSHDRRNLDALPLPEFRDHVALASVSISPDADGLVRAMPLATVTAGTPRPSLSAYIAARQGQADTDFPIDFSIRPETIPRLSFASVRDGRFDAAAVRDRDVLIGATAIEMGDRYATTFRGVLPGVVVQALAAETLTASVPMRGSAFPTLLIALLLALPMVITRQTGRIVGLFAASAGGLSAAVIAAQHQFAVHYPLGTGVITLLAAAIPTIARDIAGRFDAARMIDEATGLPNQRALLAAGPEGKGEIAVAQINNLDALSAILGNEDMGRAVSRAAERLALLSVDRTVYRVRSHHLAIFLSAEQPVDDVMAAMRAVLLQPVEVSGRKIDIAISVGVAGEEGRVERLTSAALAAQEASQAGVFWRRASNDHSQLERSVILMGELDAAIASGSITVFYQPKLCLRTNRIVSAEALVRWRHPERGYVPPDVFIPLAEQTDRIELLTLHVLATVLNDLGKWRALDNDVTAAVNISARLLSSVGFNAAVDQLLAASPVPAGSLIFEVTESAAMLDPESAIAALQRYRDRGIAVSMDDYGTGQSTLTYLRGLPLSELKIDRSFIQHAHLRNADALLVRSTIDLAHELGLKVVAEGVEDQVNLHFLQSLGCDVAQGYFIGRPMPNEDFSSRLSEDIDKQRQCLTG